MENKNGIMLFSLIFLIIGIFVGWIICNNRTVSAYQAYATHRMPNGQMMNNVGMDMGSMMDGMMSGLQGKTGDDFDKEFLAEMIVHHQGAVEMAQAALKNAKHQEVKDLANGIITAQNKEIGMMKQWQVEWYK